MSNQQEERKSMPHVVNMVAMLHNIAPSSSDYANVEALGLADADAFRDLEVEVVTHLDYTREIEASFRPGNDSGVITINWKQTKSSIVCEAEYHYSDSECEEEYGPGDYSCSRIADVFFKKEVVNGSNDAIPTVNDVFDTFESWRKQD